MNFDLEEAIFADGRTEVILVPDSEVTSSGKQIYDLHQEMETIYGDGYHWVDPSDASQPRRDDPDEEYERQIWIFASIVRDWRHDFITRLLDDCASGA